MSEISADDRRRLRRRPEPDADVKPDSLRQISRRSWRYLFGRTTREFLRDECPDLAAALTYYAVLAVVPGLIALISVLGLVGQGPQGFALLLDFARRVVPASGLEVVLPILERLTSSPRAGLALALSLALGVWFVSIYLGAFGRAMNRIYAIGEGRPLWKLQPLLMALTVVFGICASLATVLVVLSGPLAEAMGEVLGLGSAPITLWGIAKWPVLVLIVVGMVAMLYYLTPNIRQPRFRWLSPGALLAILTWVAGSVLFGLYVASFPSYDTAYGSLAGVIVFLVWLWVSNIALLLGAELDAEIERARELQGGLPAEHTVQLPPRDTRATDKAAAQHEADVDAGRRLRDEHADTDYSTEREPRA